MVKKVTIGVIAIQGAISEHINSIKKAINEKKINGKVISIRYTDQIDECQGLVLPGGESTTISRILFKRNLHKKIKDKIEKKELFVMGTCAGCVVLSKEIDDTTKEVKLLELMNIKTQRNYFGRQRESFEKNIKIKGFNKPFNAIFIRAPIIEKVWGGCEVLSKIDEKIVMARQENMLALSFHPELTSDLRIHKYFLEKLL